MMAFIISDLPVPNALKDSPCAFRLQVDGANGRKLDHHFILVTSPLVGCTQEDLDALGRAIQKRLQIVDWGDDPEAAFDREITPLLVKRGMASESVIQPKAQVPELACTCTYIAIAGQYDTRGLLASFSG